MKVFGVPFMNSFEATYHCCIYYSCSGVQLGFIGF